MLKTLANINVQDINGNIDVLCSIKCLTFHDFDYSNYLCKISEHEMTKLLGTSS